jgi:tetratricopeptide (TPR) repeat protein
MSTVTIRIRRFPGWAAGWALCALLQPAPAFSQSTNLPLNPDGFSGYGRSDSTVQDILQSPRSRPKADTYYLVALSYAQKGKTNLAMETIARGLSLEPQNVPLLNLKGALLIRGGRVAEGVAEFERVLRLDPGDAYARQSLYAILGPPKPAAPRTAARPITKAPKAPQALAEKVASTTVPEPPKKLLEPSQFVSITEKKQCCLNMSAIKRAQLAQEKSKPETKGKLDLPALVEGKLLYGLPICPMGGTYDWKGDNPECSKHAGFLALEAEVNTVFADYNAGMKAKFARNFPEARQAFNRVIVMHPAWAEGYYQLGDTCFRLGEDQEAQRHMRRCLELDGKNLDAKMLLANLYFKTGHKSSALQLLNEVVSKAPQSIHAISAKGMLASIKSGKNYYQMFPPD